MSAMQGGRRNDGPARARRGFSLLELLAVTTIIGIVASVVLPRIGESASHAKGEVCLEYKAQLNVAAEKFFLANGRLPKVVNQLHGEEYYGSEVPACPVDGSAYRLNLITGRVTGHRN
ncbi:MAG: prepilin-type N-terminal cleavage/methylation domain-containing protein [Planctomycetaceae bacterium]|jgi:prepilin-type N-terminal cleavage/methylation domain-containing protein